MEDFTELSAQLKNKYEKERDKLKLIQESVERSRHLTSNMVSILSSFEHRLSKLEKTILPVYHETGNLRKQQENVEKTLAALDDVIAYYGVSKDVQQIIKDGPSVSGLKQFLDAMKRLQEAMEFFERNESMELENVRNQFADGGDALGKEFRDLLLRYSKPVPPIALLNMISNDEESPSSTTSVEAHQHQHLPDNVHDDLARISEWLHLHNRDSYLNIWAKVRSQCVSRSLQGLREYQRSASGGSTGGGSAPSSSFGYVAGGSPVMRSKFGTRHDVSGKRTKRIQHAANQMLMRASKTIEQSTGLALGSKRATEAQSPSQVSGTTSTLLPLPDDDRLDEHDVELCVSAVAAFLRLAQVEQSLMVGIVPLQHQKAIFEQVIRESLDALVQEGEAIASKARRCLSRHDFASALLVFPVLRHLLSSRSEFEKTLEGCDLATRSKFATILNALHLAGVKCLEDFLEGIRFDMGTGQLPRDGTVHELTSNALVFLEQLSEYVDGIGGMLAQEQQYAAAYNNLLSRTGRPARGFGLDEKEGKHRALLGIYIKKVLVQLNLSLVSRSDAYYSDLCLRAVFRLNNAHYVLEALQRSGLMDLVRISEPECQTTYREMIEEQKRFYAQSWSRVLQYITSNEDVPAIVLQTGKLRDKDRQIIKDKFAGFNKEIEEIQRAQRNYSIPNVALRESLIQESKRNIVPKYKIFYDKFSTATFTKNTEKYVKYTPEKVGELIESFFDVSA